MLYLEHFCPYTWCLMSSEKLPSTLLVLFGATSSISKKRILPALYELERLELLPKHFYIFAVSRKQLDAKAITQLIMSIKPTNKKVAADLARRIKPVKMDATDSSSFQKLRNALMQFEMNIGVKVNLSVYLGLPTFIYESCIENLVENKFNRANQYEENINLFIEQPIAINAKSAKHILRMLQREYKEKQIYFLDHLVSRPVAQTLMSIRDSNPIFSALWSAANIKAIDICHFEDSPVESNSYYKLGTLLNTILPSLLPMLAYTTMRTPNSLDTNEIRSARSDILKNLKVERRIRPQKRATRGQYKGFSRDAGYESDVTETFVSLPIRIEHANWRKAQIRLVAGNALSQNDTHVAVAFSDFSKKDNRNILNIRFSPEFGFNISVNTWGIIQSGESKPVTLSYNEGEGVNAAQFDTSFYDALTGDRSLFLETEEIHKLYKTLAPLIKRWQGDRKDLVSYKGGTSVNTIMSKRGG